MGPGVTVRLDAPGGLDPVAVLGSLAAHNVPGAELTEVDAMTHSRVLPGPEGPRAVKVRFGTEGVDVEFEQVLEDSESDALIRSVRRWLDLDADLDPIRAALSPDARLAPLVAARPALRVIGTTDRFQTAVTTVLGQQVSLAAGRTFSGRLVATFGEPTPSGLRAFPHPDALAAADLEELRAVVGLTSARARTVVTLAKKWSEAGTALTPEQLLAIPGIGPWTVDYLSVRFGDRDAFAPGDLVLRRALGGITAREAEARSQAWRPFRAYALVHLWTAAAYSLG
ncbi:MAG TPA: AlkA N-terminal domain-containing protein [Sinomonas sp.]|nr:AlkA N-terminal domain-containing protein [Sinomonas sp.]